VNNVIKEIRNWKLSCRVSSPIKLPWKDEMNDFGNQVSPVIVSVGEEDLSPSCKTDGHPEPGDSAAEVDSLSQMDVDTLGQTSIINTGQQEEMTLRKSTRPKQLPSSKYQDFLC
jgi:hypothetical protein